MMVKANSRKEVLQDWFDLFLLISARVVGVVVFGVFFWGNVSMRGRPDWELSATGVTGTMAGFMIAALALIEAGKSSEQMKKLIGTPSGDRLITVFSWTLLGWSFATATGMAHWLMTPTPTGAGDQLQANGPLQHFVWAVFAGSFAFSGLENLRASVWVYAVFTRYKGGGTVE